MNDTRGVSILEYNRLIDKLEATIESLTQQNKDLFARNVELRLRIVRVRKEVDALPAAIGEQNETK